jgi:hypothetical protein
VVADTFFRREVEMQVRDTSRVYEARRLQQFARSSFLPPAEGDEAMSGEDGEDEEEMGVGQLTASDYEDGGEDDDESNGYNDGSNGYNDRGAAETARHRHRHQQHWLPHTHPLSFGGGRTGERVFSKWASECFQQIFWKGVLDLLLTPPLLTPPLPLCTLVHPPKTATATATVTATATATATAIYPLGPKPITNHRQVVISGARAGRGPRAAGTIRCGAWQV